jgi:hypothetical protein
MKYGGIILTHDTIILCLGDLWTLISQRIKGVPHFELLGMRNERLNKLVVDPSLNVDAGPSTAAMAVIEARVCVSTHPTLKMSADKTPCAAHLTAWSISASSKMIDGDFPPSSSVTFFRLDAAAAFMTDLPTIVLPVKATFSMCICSAIAAPTVRP